MDSNLTPTRTPVDDDELFTLVSDKLEKLTAQEIEFTAYDVTKSLRVENPSLEISHSDVRPIVRAEMSTQTIYTDEIRTYGGGITARLYTPTPPQPVMPPNSIDSSILDSTDPLDNITVLGTDSTDTATPTDNTPTLLPGIAPV